MAYTGIYLLKDYRLFLGEELIKDETFYEGESSQHLTAKRIAAMYQPILYRQTGDYDPSPEALYYRVIINRDAICIQYYGYWAVQFYPTIIKQISLQHVYDYEPILIYIKKISELPFQVIFSGGDMLRGFHWVEVHTSKEYLDTTKPYQNVKGTIAPRCIYPFSLRGKRETTENLRVFQISDTLLPSDSNSGKFDGLRLKLAIAEYHHVYSINISKRKPLKDALLRELSDEVLTGWYRRYFEKKAVEPFQHDVSDPMTAPFIRYKKKVILSKIKAETEIVEKNENLIKLHLRVFEAVGQPITKLTNLNFKIQIDDVTTKFSIKEEDKVGSYHCTIDISKLSSGEHRLFIQIMDYLGMTSEPIQIKIS